MGREHSIQINLRSPAATTGLAATIAPLLRAGDTILLSGETGAGKTHFARAVIQARQASDGAFEDVPSPTYTLVQTYFAENCEIWHADLYRLSNHDDIAELGLNDAFDDAICLIEWPDRLGSLCPADALLVHFSLSDKAGFRAAEISWNTRRWSDIMDVIRPGDQKDAETSK